jgi:ABC-type multidrug transport system fused ATPase/permease subunit
VQTHVYCDRRLRCLSHRVELDEVGFSYDGHRVLDAVSFIVPERTMTAIVGPTGSGKITIMRLSAHRDHGRP